MCVRVCVYLSNFEKKKSTKKINWKKKKNSVDCICGVFTCECVVRAEKPSQSETKILWMRRKLTIQKKHKKVLRTKTIVRLIACLCAWVRNCVVVVVLTWRINLNKKIRSRERLFFNYFDKFIEHTYTQIQTNNLLRPFKRIAKTICTHTRTETFTRQNKIKKRRKFNVQKIVLHIGVVVSVFFWIAAPFQFNWFHHHHQQIEK